MKKRLIVMLMSVLLSGCASTFSKVDPHKTREVRVIVESHNKRGVVQYQYLAKRIVNSETGEEVYKVGVLHPFSSNSVMLEPGSYLIEAQCNDLTVPKNVKTSSFKLEADMTGKAHYATVKITPRKQTLDWGYVRTNTSTMQQEYVDSPIKITSGCDLELLRYASR